MRGGSFGHIALSRREGQIVRIHTDKGPIDFYAEHRTRGQFYVFVRAPKEYKIDRVNEFGFLGLSREEYERDRSVREASK